MHAPHFRGIKRQIQARSDSNFQHFTARLRNAHSSQPRRLFVLHRQLNEPRQNVPRVKSHRVSSSAPKKSAPNRNFITHQHSPFSPRRLPPPASLCSQFFLKSDEHTTSTGSSFSPQPTIYRFGTKSTLPRRSRIFSESLIGYRKARKPAPFPTSVMISRDENPP